MFADEPASEVRCFHCGLPVRGAIPYRADMFGTQREFCCAGCKAVAQTIDAAGLCSYYETRESPRGKPLAADLPELSQYADPVAQREFVIRLGEHEREVVLLLEGVTCAACVWLIERHLRALRGITRADVNRATARAVVAWDERELRLPRILQALRDIGYAGFPFDPSRQSSIEAKERRAALWRLFVSGFAAMQVMMYAIPAYLDDGGTLSPEASALMRWAGFALTLPVILFACGPFFAPAWRALRTRRMGLDAPIALGILGGFGASAWATFAGEGEVYFDSIAMLVFLLLAARTAETAVRKKAAGALDPLLRWMPTLALRIRDPAIPAQPEKVAAHELLRGDFALVPAGERIPADGTVVQGVSSADESLLTGESLPVQKSPGAAVIAGSVNLEQPVVVEVERAGNETRAAQVTRLIERAAASRPELVAQADQIGARFAWWVIASAVLAFAIWSRIAPDRAVWIAVAMLVATCPCALALAAPIALGATTGQLLRRGIVLTRGRAIETIARATDVVFDKTGTLTEGRLRIARIDRFAEATEAECRQLARALESGSRHPVAAAFTATEPGNLAVSEIRHVSGQGIEGRFRGKRVRIGTEDFCRGLPGSSPPTPKGDPASLRTRVYLADETAWLAAFLLEDQPRHQSAEVLAALRASRLQVHLLSGDRRDTVATLAGTLQIAHFAAQAQPEDKVAYVQRLQQRGSVVVMVGDGVNDAPVLACADASIAMGSGAASAQLTSDMVLLGGRLEAALDAFNLARGSMRVIRQNFAWAMGYNALALPAAALGWVGPLEAALGMAASSLLVAFNSLRLARQKSLKARSWKASTFSFRSPSRSCS